MLKDQEDKAVQTVTVYSIFKHRDTIKKSIFTEQNNQALKEKLSLNFAAKNLSHAALYFAHIIMIF